MSDTHTSNRFQSCQTENNLGCFNLEMQENNINFAPQFKDFTPV